MKIMIIKKDEVNEPFYEIIFDAREDKGRTISNEKNGLNQTI